MSILEPIATDDLRFPVGRFDLQQDVARSERGRLIATIADLPAQLRDALADLNELQLDTPYREDGWTVRQLVHHVPDSHMNAYIRFKLGMTEQTPRIKTYEQGAWAELPDSHAPVTTSLDLLTALHERWVTLLTAMSDDDFDRPIDHPEWGHIPLWTMLRLYEWHSRHHLAHILRLRERMGW